MLNRYISDDIKNYSSLPFSSFIVKNEGGGDYFGLIPVKEDEFSSLLPVASFCECQPGGIAV